MMIQNKKGATLIEILITVALVGIVLPIISTLFLYAFREYTTGMKQIEQQTTFSNAYMAFRTDYEKAREIKFIKNSSSTGSALNSIQAIEMYYKPQEAVLDYTDQYKDLYLNSNAFYNFSSKPPYDKVGDNTNIQQIYEEEFYKRWEFVPNPDDPDVLSFSVSQTSGGALGPILKNNILKEDDMYQSGIFINGSENKLWLRLLPVPVNENIMKSRNITEPVEWHFDFVYKDFDFEVE